MEGGVYEVLSGQGGGMNLFKEGGGLLVVDEFPFSHSLFYVEEGLRGFLDVGVRRVGVHFLDGAGFDLEVLGLLNLE